MKSLTLTITTLISFICSSQITYVDNFDAVYPLPVYNNQSFNTSQSLDLNGDGQLDVDLYWNIVGGFTTCNSVQVGSPLYYIYFNGKTNSFGSNKVNSSNVTNVLGIDCTGDTLNINDLWNNSSMLHRGEFPSPFCLSLGYGQHKQGFRLILNNPQTNTLGYKYGYIDYSLTNNGDVVIHGWYYENTFNLPIVANSLLDYPYDSNCIVYDTITVYDTVFVSVTDTLFVETTLSTSPLSQNTIKVFPNPTTNFLTINTGNYALMSNYTLRIENNTGQTVFTGLVNQPEYVLDLSNWTGNGIYYLHLIDDQNNTLTIRKIVLD